MVVEIFIAQRQARWHSFRGRLSAPLPLALFRGLDTFNTKTVATLTLWHV
jgi:hypothetical protein